MTKCVFCGKDNEYFKGINLIGNDGVIYYYCSSKCRKNALKLKRDKRKLKWTEAFHIKREAAVAKEKAEKVHSEHKKETHKKK